MKSDLKGGIKKISLFFDLLVFYLKQFPIFVSHKTNETMKHEDQIILHKASEIIEVRKWCVEIPYINFPSEWDVKIIPNFSGSVIRFLVKKNNDIKISVYLDCYDNLGCYGKPYWEIYPHKEDVFRCDMNDTKTLIKAINEELDNK